MREGRMEVLAVRIICPYCHEIVANKCLEVLAYRITHWKPEEISPGQIVRCDMCGKDFTLPVNDERCELNW